MDAQTIRTVLGLDVGMARTGVAVANSIARIARPLTIIEGTDELPLRVAEIAREEMAVAVVVGLPRNMKGEETPQTKIVREHIDRIRAAVAIPVYVTDEAVTSVRAEAELRLRNKPFTRADVDMLAAVYILEDYTKQHPEVYEAS